MGGFSAVAGHDDIAILLPGGLGGRKAIEHIAQHLIKELAGERQKVVVSIAQPLLQVGAVGGRHVGLAALQDLVEQAEVVFDLVPYRVGWVDCAAGIEGAQGVARVIGGLLADDMHIIRQRHRGVERARQRVERQAAFGEFMLQAQRLQIAVQRGQALDRFPINIAQVAGAGFIRARRLVQGAVDAGQNIEGILRPECHRLRAAGRLDQAD